jgi:uncharacterized protein (DUF2147 family)
MTSITALLIFLFATTSSLAQKADDIIGKYRLPNKLDVEIYKSNDKYFGKIIALNGYENGQTKDIKNPDESKQKNLLIGKVIVNDLEFDPKDKIWINGKMYGPEKGMVFNLKITKIEEKEIEIVGSKFLFWKTLKWLKI